jgi:hypothetical protein
MSKLEELHLKVIKESYGVKYVNESRLASYSAQITGDIAIRFALWLNREGAYEETVDLVDYSKPDEELAIQLFNQFLKTL